MILNLQLSNRFRFLFVIVLILAAAWIPMNRAVGQNIDRVVVNSQPQVVENVVYFVGETTEGKYVKYRMEISISYRCRTGRNGWCKDGNDLSPGHVSLLQESYARDKAIYVKYDRLTSHRIANRGVMDIHEERPAGFNPVDSGE